LCCNLDLSPPQEHFYSLTKTEKHLLPRLTLQVWYNDLFNPDDFLGKRGKYRLEQEPMCLYREGFWGSHFSSPSPSPGTLDINLCAMPEPARSASACSLDQLPEEAGEGEKAREVKLVDSSRRRQ